MLNNGTLTLDHVVVTGNTMATNAGDFWQGGGGIYNGDGATLTLVDSTVSGNNAGWSGGGIYSFFNTTTTIVRSTISGNVSNDVGGGIRSLGNMTITNSTISGNTLDRLARWGDLPHRWQHGDPELHDRQQHGPGLGAVGDLHRVLRRPGAHAHADQHASSPATSGTPASTWTGARTS